MIRLSARLAISCAARVAQYVGVVMTIFGALAVLLSVDTAEAFLPQVAMAWSTMYLYMGLMEQANDNDGKRMAQ